MSTLPTETEQIEDVTDTALYDEVSRALNNPPQMYHIFCQCQKVNGIMPVGARAVCGVLKSTDRQAYSPARDIMCAACRDLLKMPCPKCGRG